MSQDISIRHMRVSIWPIMRAGSWVYLAGSWRESTSYFIIILIDIRENERIMFKLFLFYLYELSTF